MFVSNLELTIAMWAFFFVSIEAKSTFYTTWYALGIILLQQIVLAVIFLGTISKYNCVAKVLSSAKLLQMAQNGNNGD